MGDLLVSGGVYSLDIQISGEDLDIHYSHLYIPHLWYDWIMATLDV